MTIRIKKEFGPEKLLGAPRRSPAFPSPDGKLVVYTKSVYSFDSHSKSSEIAVIEVATGATTVLTRDVKASEPKWLGEGHELVWLKETENGNTNFIIADADAPGKTYTAGTVPGPISNLKLCTLEPGSIAIAVSGQATPEGSLHNTKDEAKSHSTARVYDALFVRHWDKYITQYRSSIFTAILKKAPARVHGREGTFNLVGFNNALKGQNLESPVPPFGGADHFDISPSGLVIVAKDPELNPATHTKCSVYWLPKADFMDMSEVTPIKLGVEGFNGAATSPVFSKDGKLAWLQMRTDGYESDKNEIIAGFRVPSGSLVVEGTPFVATAIAAEESWDRSPSSIMWSNNGEALYAQAEYEGAGCLFEVTLPPKGRSIRQLTTKHYIMEAVPLSTSLTEHRLLISSNSLVDNSMYEILAIDSSAEATTSTTLFNSLSNSGSDFGLSPSQVSSLWWKGDKDHPVHALMMVPSNFNPAQKYPLAYLIHGGPQGAWNDQWSTRWNPAVYAEQGYVVICPNPTGSTGYGQDFTDAIRRNWGGSPYIDLFKGFNYIEHELDFVDTTKAVALGASYGGYMMNWIQGHELGKKFKALVCHDGVFSMTAQLASEEQYFPVHDLGGPIWENQEIYDRWDPSRFTKNWSTPMLVIHNELDYRLTMAEGLAAFNVLQMKGIESRFLSFPDENHWVLKQENSLVWHLVVLNWINKFVGLSKVTDKDGNDGSEYVRQGRRSVPSDK